MESQEDRFRSIYNYYMPLLRWIAKHRGIPYDEIDDLVQEGKAKVRVLDTPDKWFGVTYQEDKQAVVDAIRGLIRDGVYKEKLFG